jgi:hypothetical protein
MATDDIKQPRPSAATRSILQVNAETPHASQDSTVTKPVIPPRRLSTDPKTPEREFVPRVALCPCDRKKANCQRPHCCSQPHQIYGRGEFLHMAWLVNQAATESINASSWAESVSR